MKRFASGGIFHLLIYSDGGRFPLVLVVGSFWPFLLTFVCCGAVRFGGRTDLPGFLLIRGDSAFPESLLSSQPRKSQKVHYVVTSAKAPIPEGSDARQTPLYWMSSRFVLFEEFLTDDEDLLIEMVDDVYRRALGGDRLLHMNMSRNTLVVVLHLDGRYAATCRKSFGGDRCYEYE